ncbi:Repeat domain-containing protein [Streptomyces sp. DvalAA-14]|nr:Repeat domain-containing protein [Streptomyces sp. DvalAA-14]
MTAAVMAVAAGLPAIGPAVADTGGMPTITVQPDYSPVPQSTDIRAANEAGYLDGTTWRGFDGSTRPDQPRANAYSGAYGLVQPDAGSTSGIWRIYDYADGTSVNIRLPNTDDPWGGSFTPDSLLVDRREATSAATLHVLQASPAGGEQIDHAVQGLPADWSGLVSTAVDGTRAAVVYGTANGNRLGELDLKTYQFTPFTKSADFTLSGPVALSGDHVVATMSGKGLGTFNWNSPGSGPAVDAFPADVGTTPTAVAVLGDWVVFEGQYPSYIVKATPIGKNEWQTVLDRSAEPLITGGTSGTAIVAGGTDARHWGVLRLAATPDGPPAAQTLAPLPALSLWQGGGLAFADRRLLVAEHDPNVEFGDDVTALDITRTAAGELGSAPANASFSMATPAGQDDCVGACRRLTADEAVSVLNDADTTVVAMAGHYRVVRDNHTGQQRLEDVWGAPQTVKVLASGAAALWGGTLWTPGTATGTVVPTDAATLKAGAAVTLGAPCVPRELQAVTSRLYWSCGPDGPAGVFDRSTGKSTAVPSGLAQLGDGYLVSQDDTAGKLRITYLPGAVPAAQVGTADLAPLPAVQGAPDDQRGLYWAVDRFGGGVAWFDASGAVQVALPQVSTSPLEITATEVGDPHLRTDMPSWDSYFEFSQPLASWTLQLRDTRTGALTWQTSGGPLIGSLWISGWNARDPLTGLPVRSGTYSWTLSATPVDDAAAGVKLSGQITAKSMEPRDYGSGVTSGDDGIGDLFTVSSKGVLELQAGNGRGGVDPHRRTVTGWSSASTLIPFGDLLGYRCNDVLERTSAGELKVWQGSCNSDFSPNNRSTSLGTGWNAYTTLLSSGDENGDGRPDLLGRDKAGDLWMFANDGKGGLKPRVKVGSGLSGYTMLVGAGDLNGDGFGDLVARDRSGVLWRWLGNGKGGWSAKAQVGTGFNSFNALVGVGDFDGDGKADLVGRSTAGNVFRWSGTGKGTFAGGARIATGWSSYRALY